MNRRDINKLVKIIVAAIGDQDHTKLATIGLWLNVKLFERNLENRETLYGIFKDIDSLPGINILFDGEDIFDGEDMFEYPDLKVFLDKYPYV